MKYKNLQLMLRAIFQHSEILTQYKQNNTSLYFYSLLPNIGGPFHGGKVAGGEGDHSSPCSAEVKNAWSYTSTFPYVFTAWCLSEYRVGLYGLVLS